MIIYLSGPITGHDDYLEKFRETEKKVSEEYDTVDIINPAEILHSMPDATTHEQYLDICICLLNMADAIYLIDGWDKSLGASTEYGYALAKDHIIIKE